MLLDIPIDGGVIFVFHINHIVNIGSEGEVEVKQEKCLFIGRIFLFGKRNDSFMLSLPRTFEKRQGEKYCNS